MKIALLKSLTLALAAIGVASADPIHFIYDGSNYGIMNLSYVNSSTVQISMQAAPDGSIAGTSDFQITGFGFNFTNSFLSSGGLSVLSPADGAFPGDQNDLTWQVYDGNFPQLANAPHTSIEFGIDEATKKNLNPPGIHMGDMDILSISGFQGLTSETDLHTVFNLQGIRIQAITYPNGGEEGSLFLAGTVVPTIEQPAVPEPSTVALMGLGLIGMAAAARRRKK